MIRLLSRPSSFAVPARFVRLSSMAVFATIMAMVIGLNPSPYSVVLPGNVNELGPRIQVPADLQHESGWLAMTTVRVGRATYAAWLRAQLDPRDKLVRTADIRPRGVSDDEHRARMARWTESSKAAAAVVALGQLGYQVEVGGLGVLIDGLEPSSAVSGMLRPGDVILEVDRRPVGSTAELVESLKRHRAGDELRVEVLRAGERLGLSLPPPEADDGHGWPMSDLQGWDYVFDVKLPFPLEILSGDVLGDSAGLMLGLSLLDALTPGRLAGGYRVAGTGTLAVDGGIGPIGGITAKLLAAEQHGADIFLAPRENAEDAARVSRRTQVIPVGSFDEALAALRALADGADE